jgi:UDP-2-acetamido-3-amino-2,3-dideoxy-glucuronate N-acetyltransferase
MASSAPTDPGNEMTRRDGNAKLIELEVHPDARGKLVVGECGAELPFVPMRFFFVQAVPSGAERGHHAVNCEELFVACAGSVSVGVYDGSETRSFRLERPDVALYLPPDTYCWQYDFTADALLLVFASEPYRSVRYISDRGAYEALKRETPGEG